MRCASGASTEPSLRRYAFESGGVRTPLRRTDHPWLRLTLAGADRPLSGEDPQATEYAIAWGNWRGSSSLADGQRRVVIAWNPARVVGIWGDVVSSFHQQELQTVGDGTLPYTKASYLRQVRNGEGWKIVFEYQQKISPSDLRKRQRNTSTPTDAPYGDVQVLRQDLPFALGAHEGGHPSASAVV